MTKKILAVSIALLLSATMAVAMDKDHSKMNHSNMDHSSMGHGSGHNDSMEKKQDGAMGVGVIHSVSKLNRMVNLTHEPIPELNWPEMTMDLAVAKDVDLNSVKTGEKVKFHLVLGDDNVFRITSIEK